LYLKISVVGKILPENLRGDTFSCTLLTIFFEARILTQTILDKVLMKEQKFNMTSTSSQTYTLTAGDDEARPPNT